MDLFGVVVLATVTALGGGTLRDFILGAYPVFWVSSPIYLMVAVATAIMTFFLVRFGGVPRTLLSVADAFGLAVFTVVGTQKALDIGASLGIAVVMGIMTGVVGGMLRDVLSGEIPLILRREIYATASLCGAITFSVVLIALRHEGLAALASVAVTLGFRRSGGRFHFLSSSLGKMMKYNEEKSNEKSNIKRVYGSGDSEEENERLRSIHHNDSYRRGST